MGRIEVIDMNTQTLRRVAKPLSVVLGVGSIVQSISAQALDKLIRSETQNFAITLRVSKGQLRQVGFGDRAAPLPNASKAHETGRDLQPPSPGVSNIRGCHRSFLPHRPAMTEVSEQHAVNQRGSIAGPLDHAPRTQSGNATLAACLPLSLQGSR